MLVEELEKDADVDVKAQLIREDWTLDATLICAGNLCQMIELLRGWFLSHAVWQVFTVVALLLLACSSDRQVSPFKSPRALKYRKALEMLSADTAGRCTREWTGK